VAGGGNSLKYVQDQLGHGDIRTTERYYGHLERHVKKEGAKATEAAIARAVREHNGRRRGGYAARRARADSPERLQPRRSVVLSGRDSMRPWRR
jgi:hypothetical protein